MFQLTPPVHAKDMTVGHLREVIAGLPDDMPIGPDFICDVGDADPAVTVHGFGVYQRPKYDDAPLLLIGVSLHYLNEDADDDENEEDDES